MSKSLSRKLTIGKNISKGMVKAMMTKPSSGMIAAKVKVHQNMNKKTK